ncbi:hypothetical protein BDV18DRAFT_129000 [Aspergillus unguis]
MKLFVNTPVFCISTFLRYFHRVFWFSEKLTSSYLPANPRWIRFPLIAQFLTSLFLFLAAAIGTPATLTLRLAER